MSMWYEPSVTLSHNKKVNMVVSMRGGGKTVNTLNFIINQFKSKGEQFIYLRRTKEELKLVKDKIFDDIKALGLQNDVELTVRGFDLYCNGELMGYCVPLSLANNYKSNAFPKVKYMIFEEFLPEDRVTRVLPNEVNRLMGFVETCFRMRDFRLFMLANLSSANNIYFNHFKLYPKAGATFIKHPTKSVMLHLYDNAEYREVKRNTDFAEIISGTAYGEFILNNSAFNDNTAFIERLTGKSEYWYTVKWSGRSYGAVYSPSKGCIWFTDKVDPSAKKIFAFDTDDHEPNIILLKQSRNHPIIKQTKYALENGVIRFENLGVKYAILEMLNYL